MDTIERLKIRKLHRDLDALAPLAVGILILLDPAAAHAYAAHTQALNELLGLAFGGRFAVRLGSVLTTGRTLAAVAPELARVEAVWPPSAPVEASPTAAEMKG